MLIDDFLADHEVILADDSAKILLYGYVYFIRRGRRGAIKIGYARDPLARLGELQVGCPDKLTLWGCIPGLPVTERVLHKLCRPYRMRGEWYNPKPEVMQLIKCLIDRNGASMKELMEAPSRRIASRPEEIPKAISSLERAMMVAKRLMK